MRRRTPHNPAAQIHDRRSSDFNRGIAGHMAPVEVDDPFEQGGKIVVMRNTRNDPLAGMHDRDFISRTQYDAGRAFQRDFEIAERGPRAIDPGKEAVDGGRLPEPITEAQQAAVLRLARAHKALGQDGSAIIADVLIHRRGISQMVSRRGLSGGYWRDLFGKKLGACLNALAVIYGLANEPLRPSA